VGQILARLASVRTETNRSLGDLTPAAITRPSAWVGYEVDVRFRLHRFPAHLIEHTIQCDKTLEALGWRSTEGRHMVRRWPRCSARSTASAAMQKRGSSRRS
jgi:hypothetical protein